MCIRDRCQSGPGAERWTSQGCCWIYASPGLVTHRGARLKIPDKLLKPTFPSLPHIARTSHTPIDSPPLPGLAHWTDSKGLSAGVQSRLNPCPLRTNKRTIRKVLLHDTIPSKGMCSKSRDLFRCWEISDDILLTVEDRDLFAIEL